MRPPIPKPLREKIKAKYGGRCGYCGLSSSNLQIDHIVPYQSEYWRDGVDPNRPENLMPACAPCNNYKSVRTLEQFRSDIQYSVSKARRYNVNFRFAEKYRLIEVKDSQVKFYFEEKHD